MVNRQQTVGKPRKLILILICGLAMLSTTAMAFRHWRFQKPENPPAGQSSIGTIDQPTTDLPLINEALEQVASIPSFSGPGWVHLQYTGYHTPPNPPHPLHPKDGYLVLDEWFYVNKQGMVEKNLQMSTDRQGNVLQECVCVDEICGNISKAALPEFDDEPISQPFQPFPFSINSAVSQIHEVNREGAQVTGWEEASEFGPAVLISSYTANTEEQMALIPGFEGSLITIGVLSQSGVLSYFSLYEKTDGEFLINFEDKLSLYEVLESNPTIDQEIARAAAALKAREEKRTVLSP